MKATCTFNYDRYICGKTSSKSWWEGLHINLTGNQRNNAYRTDDAEYRTPSITIRDDAPQGTWNTQGVDKSLPETTSTDYNPNSGHAPGYSPGSKEGSHI